MSLRILIVDSNLPFLVRLRKALEKEGYDIRAISRPKPALKELSQEAFDVAVVDLNMDWVSMPTFIKDMRSHQPNLPIILSGQYPEDPEQVPILEAQGYLNKPYVARDLLPLVNKAIEKGYKSKAKPKDDLFASEFSDIPSFDQLLEMALVQSNEAVEEQLEDEATIGQLLTSLYDHDVEEAIMQRVRDKSGTEISLEDAISGHIEDTQQNPALVIPDDELVADAGVVEIVDERAEALQAQLERDQNEFAETLIDEIIAEPTPPQGTTVKAQGHEPTESLPVTSALRLTSNDRAMSKFLAQVEAWVNQTGKIKVHPLPSWSVKPTTEELAYQKKLLDALHLVPEKKEITEEFAPPHTEQTQSISVPEIDLYLDETDTPSIPMPAVDSGDFIDYQGILSSINVVQDVSDIPVPVDESAPENEIRSVSDLLADEEELISMSVDEVTQAMGFTLEDVDQSAEIEQDYAADEEEVEETFEGMHPAFEPIPPSPDEEAVAEFLQEVDLIGHATLQLINLSLDSTARGIMLTHDDRIVARSGELPSKTWSEISRHIFDAWRREGNPNTRVVYPTLDTIGKSLIYSLNTVHDLKLSMVFPEDTHIGNIRRQAAILQDALIANPDSDIIIEQPIAEEVAAPTLPNRPTELRQPEELRQVEVPVERKKGSYMGYACAWLLQSRSVELNDDVAEAIREWIADVADQKDWDIHDLEIGRGWVNLHLGIPSKGHIGEAVALLMDETNRRILEGFGRDPESDPPVWIEGYSVSTPGRIFDHDEIARFARFYHEQKLN